MILKEIAKNTTIYNTITDSGFLEVSLFGYIITINVVVGETSKLIDKTFLKEFSEAAMAFVKAENRNKSPKSKLTASINILLSRHVDQSAIKFSRRIKVPKIGEREIPVVYDINSKKYYTFRWYNIWGFFHTYYYMHTMKEVIAHLEKNNFKLFSK